MIIERVFRYYNIPTAKCHDTPIIYTTAPLWGGAGGSCPLSEKVKNEKIWFLKVKYKIFLFKSIQIHQTNSPSMFFRDFYIILIGLKRLGPKIFLNA